LSNLRDKFKELEKEVSSRFIGNRDAIHALILNQLHQRSASLVRAHRGLGKSTLMLLLLKGLCGEDLVVVSGASEVKRGEVIGRLHIPSLEREGVEKVLWAEFTKVKGKGLDEVNRLNPYTSANVHHMMQFGEVWAYGQRTAVEDYVLFANENPGDPTTFLHPPPFYDRFDVCVYLGSLSWREKFLLQDLMEKYSWQLVESMPQVLSFEELEEARKEVAAVKLNSETMGQINLLVRDFQVCIRNREESEVKPPALCEGCHFIRDICSSIKEPPSERATTVLTHLAKSLTWLDGSVNFNDLLNACLWALPHRITLVRVRNLLQDISSLLDRERAKTEDRDSRKQWAILNELYKGYIPSLYKLGKEAASEDIVFAEELMRLEEQWVKEGRLKGEETISAQMGWRLPSPWRAQRA
jgi:MoxR-like ATPase